MTSREKKSLVLAGIIGSLMGTYDDNEKTKLHKKIQLKIRKSINLSHKKYRQESINTVMLGDKIWKKTVDHFAGKETTIEASNLVVRLVIKDENLAKYGFSRKTLEKWAKPCYRADAKELELATAEVVKFIISECNTVFGIEEVKVMPLGDRLAKMRSAG